MKTLSAQFIKRANEVMEMAFGRSVVSIKRSLGYGSGMEEDLIYEFPHFDERLDIEDMEYIESCCPTILKDNKDEKIYIIDDCIPIHIEDIPVENISEYYIGLNKIKKLLKKRGF
jgi:hypothetical protein